MHNTIVLRDVAESDFPTLFEHQKDPEASRLAAFLPRDPSDRDAFLAHWRRIVSDPTIISKAILWNGQVAGTVGSFLSDGKPQVTYWIGKEFWGNGIAAQALTKLLRLVRSRPLYASTANDNVASNDRALISGADFSRQTEKCGRRVRSREKDSNL